MKTLNELLSAPLTHTSGIARRQVIDSVVFGQMNTDPIYINGIKAASVDARTLSTDGTTAYHVMFVVKRVDSGDSLFDNECLVSCSCPHFMHRYYDGNLHHGCLLNAPVVRLSNPCDDIGLCKHLIKASDYLPSP